MNRILVLLTFFVSGATALMYELAWTRSFQLILGSTIYSASAIFSSMLLGFALGSYASSSLADRISKPLRAAMFIEWSVGLYSILLEVFRQLASRHLDLIPSSQFLRVIVSIALVLPPAVMFGSLWPLIMRYWITDTQELGFGSGTLYAANSVGSGLGAFAGGYFLIPLLGISRSCLLTAGLNFLAGIVLFSVQRKSSGIERRDTKLAKADVAESSVRTNGAPDFEPRGKPLMLTAFFVSGMAAMIYQLTWIRPITTIFSSTIYAVSIILASFMFGLAVGSASIRRFVGRIGKPLLVYAVVEGGIGLYCIFLLGLFGLLNVVLTDVLSAVHNLFGHHLIQFLTVFFLLAVPTSLMGATFPLLAQAYVGSRVGKGIGELYAINNAGAILGTLSAGFWLLPQLGVRLSTMCAVALNFAASFAILIHFFPRFRRYSLILGACLCYLLYVSPDYSIKRLYTGGAYGLFTKKKMRDAPSRVLFYEEGMYGTVFVSRAGRNNEVVRLLINGRGSSSTRRGDVRVSTLLGFLPVLLKPDASRALAIGFGTGITSHILTGHFETTTVEIEPTVVETAPFFSFLNGDVLSHSNHTIVYDDARGYLITTENRYDIVVNHPLDPFQSYSSLLFTREFFEIVRDRLTPDGLYVQWLPTYHLSPQELRDFFHTLHGVFPHCAVFLSLKRGERIVYVIAEKSPVEPAAGEVRQHSEEIIWVCSGEEFSVDRQLFSDRFQRLDPYHRSVLGRTALDTGEKVHDLLLLTDRDLEGYGHGASVLTDDRPRLEFTTPFRWIEKRGRSGGDRAMDDLLLARGSGGDGIRP